jgi:hypothetical protein
MRAGDRDRLLAGRLHVEAGLALPLGAEHALVIGADHHHVAQDAAQGLGVEPRVPGSDRTLIIVEDPDQPVSEVPDLIGRDRDVRARDRARRRLFDMTEVDLVARSGVRLRDVEFERRSIAALRRFQHS